MKKAIYLLFCFLPVTAFSQNCNCESNYNWVKKTFEENDAGYAFSLQQKGRESYDKHNEIFAQKVQSISNSTECTRTLYQWLRFFRSGHIAIRRLNQGQNQQVNQTMNEEPSDNEIIAQFRDWENVEIDISAFSKYLQTEKKIDYEGIWVSEPYTIGIKKINNEYVGFIIEADGVYWTKGQVKLKINEDNTSVFYMRDHSAEHFVDAELLGKNYLQLGFVRLKRVIPELETEPEIERYFRAIAAQKPYFEELNEQTNILRIPKFWGSEKSDIDSVIAQNRSKILSTKNLIIDLRNNGGGSDRSYYDILPLIYTDTIRTVGLEFLSTPLNNQRMLDYISNPDYGFTAEEKDEFQRNYNLLSSRIGEFVNIDSMIVYKTSYDTIYPYPRRVGIIINENNASTTEQFLLAAKQSKKVKLFGTRTFGSLDVSNMNFVTSPCQEFELGYCLSKSFRIPKMAIDEVGIQPDFFIDDSVPKYEWIEFVDEVLNK